MRQQVYSFVKYLAEKIRDGIVNLESDDEVDEIVDLFNCEENGTNHLGSIHNPDDVRYLFDAYGGDNPRVSELALMVNNRDSNFFTLCNNEATFIGFDELEALISAKAFDMAKYLIDKPEEFPYLWEEYVTNQLNEKDCPVLN